MQLYEMQQRIISSLGVAMAPIIRNNTFFSRDWKIYIFNSNLKLNKQAAQTSKHPKRFRMQKRSPPKRNINNVDFYSIDS